MCCRSAASLNNASVRRYLGNGDGTFQLGVNYASATVHLYLHAADFNGDGFLDVATDARFNGVLSLQLNDGKGGLSIARSVQMGGES
ncbi:MAG TPA: VCBS repeat-containing protein, partial [Gemmataceae bacterium]|nr:VCBS repeat-containing protein [Gemmataceae bacterium]